MALVSSCEEVSLCTVCSDVLAEENLQGPYAVYEEPYLQPAIALQRAVQRGCPLCALLMRELSQDTTLRQKIFIDSNDRFHLPEHRLILDTSISILNENFRDDKHADLMSYCLRYSLYYEGRFFNIKIHLAPTLLSHDSQMLKVAMTLSDTRDDTTASDISWGKCVAWLKTCTTSHKICGLGGLPNGIRPTRLIHVGHGSNWPRLCYSNGNLEQVHYVTLSHCWGNSKMPTLTKDTHNKYLAGIDPKSLPRTFRDAITVTKRLSSIFGVQYLWIDALCIFQDSLEDWRHEGSLMDEIYLNAWCNLSAAKGRDGESGLFSQRDPIRPQSVFLQSIVSENSCPVEQVAVPNDIWEPVTESTLSKRAWVHQERTLSRRILYFTYDEIFWECQRLRSSESIGPFARSIPEAYLEKALIESEVIPSVTTKDILQLWACCILNYTRGELSHPEDKLPAVSGLAKRLQRYFPQARYLAGLWSIDLEKQLLWVSNYRNNNEVTRSEKYRAPSWSWACIDGSIMANWDDHWNIRDGISRTATELRKATLVVTIVGATTETVARDPFGQVRSGVLCLVGPLWADLEECSSHYDVEVLLPPTALNAAPQKFSKVVFDCPSEYKLIRTSEVGGKGLISLLSMSHQPVRVD